MSNLHNPDLDKQLADDNAMEISESDLEPSSDDSLTTQLDQIGRLNLNLGTLSFASYLPNFKPNFDLPNYVPNFDLPNLREISFDYKKLPDLRDYIPSYTRSSVAQNEPQNNINTIKTIISSRLQMTNILNDLNLGISLLSAIDRLQPLKDVIHEAIMLPVEDEHHFEPTIPVEQTEPSGITGLAHELEIPILDDLVIPEEDLHVNQTSHTNNGSRRRKRLRKIRSDSSRVSSEVDGLSTDETRELTNLDSLEDFYKQDLMRLKIQKIQKLDNISQVLKNKLVTRLMMGNYYKYVNEKVDGKFGTELVIPDDLSSDEEVEPDPVDLEGEMEDEIEDEVILTENDVKPSYFSRENDILGCPHYQRNCKVECPTCLKWYPCRFCHDQEITDHKLTRNEVKHILCMFCTTPQEPTDNYCIECDKELANYFCSICKLYDNDDKKDIYHCDKCGICRLGLGLGKDYFHCDTCNICLSIDLKHSHKCVNNTTHCNCPICNEYLFTSVTKVVFMGCGHLIHESCYKDLTQHSYKCPICKKSVVNMDTQFRILDQEILQQPLPMPYKLWRCIISCNDCKGKSNVAYHLLGLKCKYCNSYNTNQLKLIKPEEEPEDEVQDNDSVDRMALIQTNLSDNFVIDNDYDGDYNKSITEDSLGESLAGENSDKQSENLVDIKRYTKLINKPENNEVSYVTSIFQKYINNALKNDTSDV